MKLPLRIRQHDESFIITDNAGLLVAAVYFEDERGRRNSTMRMDRENAREVAKRIARTLSSNG